MKALWNNLFVPALVVALGFSAANVHADDKSNNGGSRGSSQHTSSPAKSSSGKTSSPASTSSAKPGPGMNTSKPSGEMKKDTTPVGNKNTTNPKKDNTSTTSKPTDGKQKQKSTGKPNQTDKKQDHVGMPRPGTGKQKQKNTDTPKPTDGKGKPVDNKKDSPWGEQTGKGTKPTKPGKDSYPASTHKMDPCPKEMPKHKTGGHYTQEQCAPKWNTCATYNKWTSCPDQWHVSFRNSYCLPTNYCFWQKKYYDARCGCYTYYDSYSSGWYYYEPVVKCYIPVTYCEQYAEERTESLEEVDVCEVEVPVCETVRNYLVLPVKPACSPYNYARHGR